MTDINLRFMIALVICGLVLAAFHRGAGRSGWGRWLSRWPAPRPWGRGAAAEAPDARGSGSERSAALLYPRSPSTATAGSCAPRTLPQHPAPPARGPADPAPTLPAALAPARPRGTVRPGHVARPEGRVTHSGENWLWVDDTLTGQRSRLLLNVSRFRLAAVLTRLFDDAVRTTSDVEFLLVGETWYAALGAEPDTGWTVPSVAGVPLTRDGLPLLPGTVLVEDSYRLWVEPAADLPQWAPATTRLAAAAADGVEEMAAACSPYALAVAAGSPRDAFRMAIGLSHAFDPNQPWAAVQACERTAGPMGDAARDVPFAVVGLSVGAGSLTLSAAANAPAWLTITPPHGRSRLCEIDDAEVAAGDGRAVEWKLGGEPLEEGSLVELTLREKSGSPITDRVSAIGVVPDRESWSFGDPARSPGRTVPDRASRSTDRGS